MQRTIRFLLISLLVISLSIALPWAGILLDRRFALIWRLPFWIEPLSLFMLFAGASIALWYFWRMTFQRDGSSDSIISPMRPEESNPLRRSLNPLMLSGWLCGAAIAFLLRSLSLFGFIGIIVITGAFYVRSIGDPPARSLFGDALIRYAKRAPRWLMLLVIAGTAAASVPALNVDDPPSRVIIEPAILVQIRCKPGTSMLWQTDFDLHIRPAIDEVIVRGNGFTSFQFIQSTLPWQSFDFALLYTGKTFADLDQPKAPPHYAALFRREGSVRAFNVLKEMSAYEEQVSVTLVYLNRTR